MADDLEALGRSRALSSRIYNTTLNFSANKDKFIFAERCCYVCTCADTLKITPNFVGCICGTRNPEQRSAAHGA